MAIRYDKLMEKLDEGGYNTYKLKQSKLMGQATYQALLDGKCSLSIDVLDRLCKEFNCQPGDLLAYVPDEKNVVVSYRKEKEKKETKKD